MEFHDRIDKVLNDRMVSKAAVARQIEMPPATFVYKCENLERWSYIEFNKMVKALRLTEEEIAFLCGEGQCG